MKNTVVVLLVTLIKITPVCLWGSESTKQVQSGPTQAIDCGLQTAVDNVSKNPAVAIAREKILTRVDAACIEDNVLYSSGINRMTMKQFRESSDFQQRTGPQYHSQSDATRFAIIENPDFKPIFRQQLNVVARALVNNQLQPPEWVHERIRMWANEPYGWVVLEEKFERLACAESQPSFPPGYFVPESEWFARRAAVINGYYNDKSLFPAGAPAQILPPQPQTVSKVDSCVLQ